MAGLHKDKDTVISLDLENFFGSITTEHLLKMFSKYGIEGKASKLISELCTYKYFLPQGGVTSPKLSNLITANTFGPKVKAYCDVNGLTMSVYADDIIISYNGKKDEGEIIRSIRNIVKNNGGFRIKNKKTKVMGHSSRQVVCGMVVNSKVNLVVEERNRLRAIIYNIFKNGFTAEAEKSDTSVKQFANIVGGRLNWYKQLNPIRAAKLEKQFVLAKDKYKEQLNA